MKDKKEKKKKKKGSSMLRKCSFPSDVRIARLFLLDEKEDTPPWYPEIPSDLGLKRITDLFFKKKDNHAHQVNHVKHDLITPILTLGAGKQRTETTSNGAARFPARRAANSSSEGVMPRKSKVSSSAGSKARGSVKRSINFISRRVDFSEA